MFGVVIAMKAGQDVFSKSFMAAGHASTAAEAGAPLLEEGLGGRDGEERDAREGRRGFAGLETSRGPLASSSLALPMLCAKEGFFFRYRLLFFF